MSRMLCALAFVVTLSVQSIAQLALPPSQEFVWLGESGELIVPLSNTPRPADSAAAVVRTQDSIILFDLVGGALIATIKNDGDVTISKTVPHGVTTLAQFPNKVTPKSENDFGSILAPGTVIAREMSKNAKVAPRGCAGWAVQTGAGGVFMPRQDSQKPSNFLWIVRRGKKGFSLIHSGARTSGTLVSVDKNHVITFGESATKFLERVLKVHFRPIFGPIACS